MGRSGDREVDTGSLCPGQGQAPRTEGRRAPPGLDEGRIAVTRVSDEDYRCVWRPCHALEESGGGDTTG